MISDRQMKRTLMIELFSTTGLFLSAMADNLQQLLVGIGIAILYAIYFIWLGERFHIEEIGKIRKSIYSVRFFIYACFLGSLMKVLVTKMLLPGASGWYVFLPAYLLAIYANRGGREERARLMEVLFWFIFLPLFLVLLLALKEVHLSYVVEGGLKAEKSIQVFLCFCSLEILLLFHGAKKDKVKALTFVIALNILIFLITIGMYGTKLAQSTELPVVTVIQMVRFPGGFVERLDIFILAFWILSLFAIFSAYCFYGTFYWKQEVRKKKRNISCVSTLFYIFVFVVVSFQKIELQKLLDLFQNYILWMDVPLAIILPLLGNRKMKRTIAVTMLGVLLLIVTGCGPQRVNIEERAYVLALGIEKENDLWKVGFFLPENEYVPIEGHNWEEIESNFQKSNEKEMELGHLKAIVIHKGADFSRLESQWKEEDYPKTALLFKTRDSMNQLQKAENKTKDPLGTRLTDLARRNKKETSLGDYLAGTKEIPEITIREDRIVIDFMSRKVYNNRDKRK